MTIKTISRLLFITFFLFTELFAQAAMTTTGSGIRVKKIALFNVNVYSISHAMKDVPAKNAQEIINAETDKKFTLKMLREVDSAKIVNAINDAFKLNGFNNKSQQDTFSSVLTGDLAEGDVITISYNAASKAVTCSYKGKVSTVNGSDFMKAVWSIWFGKIDQPALTNSLMSGIK